MKIFLCIDPVEIHIIGNHGHIRISDILYIVNILIHSDHVKIWWYLFIVCFANFFAIIITRKYSQENSESVSLRCWKIGNFRLSFFRFFHNEKHFKNYVLISSRQPAQKLAKEYLAWTMISQAKKDFALVKASFWAVVTFISKLDRIFSSIDKASFKGHR